MGTAKISRSRYLLVLARSDEVDKFLHRPVGPTNEVNISISPDMFSSHFGNIITRFCPEPT